MWFGFWGLVQDFTATNPGYNINPKRVNGSAVETIFSQLKHTTSGNLTAANYESAKVTLLTRAQCKGKLGCVSFSCTLSMTVRPVKKTKIIVTIHVIVHFFAQIIL